MKARILLLSLPLLLAGMGGFAQNHSTQGYYKDVFMDAGIKLTSKKDLPAARYMGLSLESYYSASDKEGDPLTIVDTIMQNAIMVGTERDQNGVLLYPDGEPRFRMIYVNGGKATAHGMSLGIRGRENLRQFVRNGGSYVGTCAGAFISSARTINDTLPEKPGYLHLWKGVTEHSGLYETPTGHFIEKGSPLLEYNDFGGDMYIDSVMHWGGCFINPEAECPAGTQILLRYDYPQKRMHRQPSCWAIKDSVQSGRVVVIGSHPESIVSGERLDLMSALMRYAMDGNGVPQVKCELQNGEVVEMSRMTVDNDPAHTRIGDRQYHHFKVTVPEHVEKMEIRLMPADTGNVHSLSLLANKDDFAFMRNASHKNIALGIAKVIELDYPAAGTYYVSVFGEDTVIAETGRYGTVYTGNLDVLNGIPYRISVTWK